MAKADKYANRLHMLLVNDPLIDADGNFGPADVSVGDFLAAGSTRVESFKRHLVVEEVATMVLVSVSMLLMLLRFY